MADKHLAKGRRRIVVLNRKEREQNKQLKHLKTGEFAIRILLTDPMTLLCILMLFIMVDMLFIALLESLFAKNSWSSPIIYLFLFMTKGCYIVCLATFI